MSEAKKHFETKDLAPTGPKKYYYQELLVQAIDIGGALSRGHAETAEVALKFLDPDADIEELFNAYLQDPAKIGTFLKDFAPMAPFTLACQLAKEEKQSFSSWLIGKFLIGAQFMIENELRSEHQVVDVCLTLMIGCLTMLGLSEKPVDWHELPRPLVQLVGKLVAHRLGVQVSEDIAGFEPHHWLAEGAATCAGDFQCG